MKIAFVYDAAYPWVNGGVEVRIYELSRRLVARGHDVHWYTLGWWWDNETQDDLVMDGIKFHGVSKPIPIYTKDRRSIKEALYFSFKLLRPLLKERFDVIDCQGFPFFSCFTSWFHSILGRSNLIITLHEVWGNYWYTYLGRLGIFGQSVEFLMLHLTSNIITVSQKTNNDLQSIRSVNSTMIPNGIDIEHIKSIKPSLKHADIIFAGRLIKEKGVDLLIKSIPIIKEKYPEFKCIIAGEGTEKDSLEILSRDLHLEGNLEFTGFLDSQDELFSLIKSAKIFVLPSQREGFGMVVLEANACGLPVVVVDHPMNAALDLVEEGFNGFIAQATPEDLAQKILMGKKEGGSLKSNCFKKASSYDWNSIIPVLEEYYQERKR